ncbi:hypothetical protein HXZ96_16420, partial [Myroides sp. 1372]|nr:hypothetical protein [Myroides sp. R163-1]MDM1070638.1 hypothetical protein [Myroides sp. 1372]
MKRKVIPLFALMVSSAAIAQVGIGTERAASSAQLEILADHKGILIPRVKLVDLADFAPIQGEKIESLLIYHTGENNINAGFYYWRNNIWIPLLSGDTVTDRMNNSFTIGTNPSKNNEESLIITDSENHSVYLAISEIANNNVFVTELVENQEFITKLGDNIDFINQITNNNEFIENIIHELKGKYGNVGFDTVSNSFFYYDENGQPVTIDWDVLGNTKIASFTVNNDFLTLVDTEGTTFSVSIDDLGKVIANNDVFVTELVENQEFITKLGDNIDFINQITNNNEFIENIIHELKGKYGNVGFDTVSNSFFYYDENGQPVTIDWDVLGNTKIASFTVNNDFLTILDTEGTTFSVSIDDLGKVIANNDVFVTELVENQEFITKLGDNIDFINQITNNNEFIENIIHELKGKYGNVGFDTVSNSFFYYDENGQPVTI